MPVIDLFTSASGLNTTVDPVRLKYNSEVGISDLATAVNITIDNTGRISRRLGWNLKEAGEFHSLWCDGGDCFVIKETETYASIMQVLPDLSVYGVRAYLTKDKQMSWVDVNGVTYYSNTFQNGFIKNGISDAWSIGTYTGPDTSRSFTSVPLGSHLTFYKGRIVIAMGSTLWFTEPNSPGLVDSVRGFWNFASDILMVKDVEDGLFVSDSNATYFLRGSSPHDFVQDRVATYPAHKWSVCTDKIEIDDLELNEDGLGVLWSSSKGICIGLPSGRIRNLTKERLNLPKAYTKGASLLCGYHIINTIY